MLRIERRAHVARHTACSLEVCLQHTPPIRKQFLRASPTRFLSRRAQQEPSTRLAKSPKRRTTTVSHELLKCATLRMESVVVCVRVLTTSDIRNPILGIVSSCPLWNSDRVMQAWEKETSTRTYAGMIPLARGRGLRTSADMRRTHRMKPTLLQIRMSPHSPLPGFEAIRVKSSRQNRDFTS